MYRLRKKDFELIEKIMKSFRDPEAYKPHVLKEGYCEVELDPAKMHLLKDPERFKESSLMNKSIEDYKTPGKIFEMKITIVLGAKDRTGNMMRKKIIKYLLMPKEDSLSSLGYSGSMRLVLKGEDGSERIFN